MNAKHMGRPFFFPFFFTCSLAYFRIIKASGLYSITNMALLKRALFLVCTYKCESLSVRKVTAHSAILISGSAFLCMARRKNLNLVDERNDEEAWPYIDQLIEQLMNDQNCSESQAHISPSNESNDSTSIEQNDESGFLETRKVRGPTLLRDIWNMPTGKTIIVKFNNRNQAIGKEGRKLASFLGIIARTPKLIPLNIVDWRSFDKDGKKKLVELVRKKFSIPTCGEEFVKKSLGRKWKDYKCELRHTYMTMYKTKYALLKNRPNHIPIDQWTGLVSYWVSEKAKKRSQANRSNRTKQKMPHTGGSKSIGTLMDEMAKDGKEPTRAEVFILTHKERKDGRPLDEESAKIVDMLQEKLNNGEASNEQLVDSVAWEGDVYSQVLGNERSGYVRGLGLGPTPSLLWGTKAPIGNIVPDNIPNEVVQRLEQEVRELKEVKEKSNEEMNLMKQNQDKMLLELSLMRECMSKFFLAGLSMPQNIIGSSSGQVPNANRDHELAPEGRQMSFQSRGIDENVAASRGDSGSKDGSDGSRKRTAEKVLDSRVSAKRTNNKKNSRRGHRL